MSIHQKLYFWVENKIEICTTKVVYHRFGCTSGVPKSLWRIYSNALFDWITREGKWGREEGRWHHPPSPWLPLHAAVLI